MNKIKRCFYGIQYRCKPSNCYGKRGIKNFLTYNDLVELWYRDDADAMLCPSIDRINTTGNYTYDNCRFIELHDNLTRTRTSPVYSIADWDTLENPEFQDTFYELNPVKLAGVSLIDA